MTRHHIRSIVIFGVTLALTTAACGDTEEGRETAVTSAATGTSTTSTATDAGGTTTIPDATTVPERAGDDPPTTTISGAPGMAEVIVNLTVAWSPEDGLSDEELASLAEAQQEVVRLLEGTSFRVIRLFEITPQLALAVDGEGLKRLEASELVAQVSPNTLDPPTG